jgi:lipoprotein-anchoring transpeptidase ErfK/SrfK
LLKSRRPPQAARRPRDVSRRHGVSIHGTNAPETIGTHVSSGCIRLTNDDVADLYSRVNVGTKVIVLPMDRRADNTDGKRG